MDAASAGDLPDRDDVVGWPGRTVVDPSGTVLGRCSAVYADDDSGDPRWLVVDLEDGLSPFVPLPGAARSGERVVVAHAQDRVVGAPVVPDTGQVRPEQEAELYEHYGVPYAAPGGGRPGPATVPRGAEEDPAPARVPSPLQAPPVARGPAPQTAPAAHERAHRSRLLLATAAALALLLLRRRRRSRRTG